MEEKFTKSDSGNNYNFHKRNSFKTTRKRFMLRTKLMFIILMTFEVQII